MFYRIQDGSLYTAIPEEVLELCDGPTECFLDDVVPSSSPTSLCSEDFLELTNGDLGTVIISCK